MTRIAHPIAGKPCFDSARWLLHVVDYVPRYALFRSIDPAFTGNAKNHLAYSAVDRLEKDKTPFFNPVGKRVTLHSRTERLLNVRGLIGRKPAFEFMRDKDGGWPKINYERVATDLQSRIPCRGIVQETKLYYTEPVEKVFRLSPSPEGSHIEWSKLHQECEEIRELEGIAVGERYSVDQLELRWILRSSTFCRTVFSRACLLSELAIHLRKCRPNFRRDSAVTVSIAHKENLIHALPTFWTASNKQKLIPQGKPDIQCRFVGSLPDRIANYVGWRPDATTLKRVHSTLGDGPPHHLADVPSGKIAGYKIW